MKVYVSVLIFFMVFVVLLLIVCIEWIVMVVVVGEGKIRFSLWEMLMMKNLWRGMVVKRLKKV